MKALIPRAYITLWSDQLQKKELCSSFKLSTWRYCYCDTQITLKHNTYVPSSNRTVQLKLIETSYFFVMTHLTSQQIKHKYTVSFLWPNKQTNLKRKNFLPWSWTVVCNAFPPMGSKSSVAVMRTSRIWPISAADIELLLSSSARSTLGGGEGKDGRCPDGNTSLSSKLSSWLE